MKPPKCGKCWNEAVKRDAGFMFQAIPFWYCLNCKIEVKVNEFVNELDNFDNEGAQYYNSRAFGRFSNLEQTLPNTEWSIHTLTGSQIDRISEFWAITRKAGESDDELRRRIINKIKHLGWAY